MCLQAAMDLKTLAEASEKAADFFESQLDENGRLKSDDVVGELAAVYKLPTLLVLTGRGRLAHKVSYFTLSSIECCLLRVSPCLAQCENGIRQILSGFGIHVTV